MGKLVCEMLIKLELKTPTSPENINSLGQAHDQNDLFVLEGG